MGIRTLAVVGAVLAGVVGYMATSNADSDESDWAETPVAREVESVDVDADWAPSESVTDPFVARAGDGQ